MSGPAGLNRTGPKRVGDQRTAILLFFLCWCAYLAAYLGRLNYAACLNEIILTEGFDKAGAGLIGTGFFFSYGAGQLVNGFLGDRFSPVRMVFLGLAGSALCNFGMFLSSGLYAMAAIWCVNGFAQSMLWSPIIRIIAEYYNSRQRGRASVNIASSPVAGTLAVYPLSALVIARGSWRGVFLIGAAATLVMAVVWLFGMRRVIIRVERYGRAEAPAAPAALPAPNGPPVSTAKVLLASGAAVIAAAMVTQGVLKEGITAWVPTYLGETFGLSPALSTAGTTLLPLCNLGGVYLSAFVYGRLGGDEVRTSRLFFAAGGVCFAALCLFSAASLPLSLVLLAAGTTSMVGVNTMMVSVMPVKFGKIGKSATLSGVIDASAYLGSGTASYGIGGLTSHLGWAPTMLALCACAALGAGLVSSVQTRWQRYRRDVL